MSRLPHGVLILILGLAVSACARGHRDINVPKPDASKASGTSLFNDDEQASFRLSRIVMGLHRSDVYANFPSGFRGSRGNYRCNRGYTKADRTSEWGSGRSTLGGWSSEFGKIFFESMKSHGANVVGDSSKLFGAGANAQGAEFLVGGRISSITGNVCHVWGLWSGRPTGESLAEFSMTVEWELFSTLTRRVVHKFSTQGYAKIGRPVKKAATKTFYNAFASAVEAAAEVDGFKKTLTRKTEKTVLASPSHKRLILTGRGHFRNPINKQIGNVMAASVTIELARGHGSGFLISRDG